MARPAACWPVKWSPNSHFLGPDTSFPAYSSIDQKLIAQRATCCAINWSPNSQVYCAETVRPTSCLQLLADNGLLSPQFICPDRGRPGNPQFCGPDTGCPPCNFMVQKPVARLAACGTQIGCPACCLLACSAANHPSYKPAGPTTYVAPSATPKTPFVNRAIHTHLFDCYSRPCFRKHIMNNTAVSIKRNRHTISGSGRNIHAKKHVYYYNSSFFFRISGFFISPV